MMARKMLQAETGWEKAETRLKTWIYTLAHELLQNQITSSLLYKLLLFIEMIQFLWYAVHPNFDFLWTVDVATWLRDAIKYFQLDAVLNEDMESIFVVCLYLVFGIQMVMLLTAVGTTYKLTRSKKKTSTIVTYSLKVLSGYSMLMTTFFALPVFNVYFASIICHDDDYVHGNLACYSGIYFLHLVVGVVGLVLHLVVMFYLNYLYIDLNPWSSIPFAAPQSKINFIRLALKIALALYIILDYTKGFTKEFIAIYGIIWIFILIFRYRQTPFYDRSVFRFALGMDSIVLWACIVANVMAFVCTHVDTLGLFYLFFGFFIFAYAFITIVERRKVVFRRSIIKNLKKDTDVEMYINVIFHLIQNREKPQHRMALEGLLKYHVKHCIKKEGECACYSLSRDYVKDEEPPEKLWYTWIKHIIVDVLERFPKSTRLHMLYAYIQREKLQNKFKALFEMMITEENKPNVEEDFSIFSYKNVIEEEMIENDARNSESKGVDVNIIVDFQNKFVDFQAAVENAVDLHLEFWRELLENNPDIQKLQSLGSKITHSFEETSAEFRKLNEINPNHIKMLQIYGNYLKDVMNDEVEGQRTLEKADYVEKSAAVNKQFIDNDHLKYGENSNTCILTVSGNLANIGIIKNVNNEITRILGFSKQDLIGQNISRIIPKIIGDLHDGFMKNYFETSEPRVIGHERLVYPLNKEGYIVPCSLMIKVLPNLDEGIRLVGFLKDVDKDGSFAKGSDFETEEKVHHIMYSGDTGAIHGITHSCKRGFGIPASLVSGANANNDFTMDIIFPELLSHTLEDLKAAAGIVTALDTSSLQQNYLLGDSESDKSDYGENEEEEKEKRFRKTNVRVGLAEDTDYQDVNIKILRFVEVYEDGEIKRQSSANRETEAEKPQDQTVKHEDESKVEVVDPNRSADYERSDKESSVSGGEAINEDIKQLKDFKALISEKTVPKSIRLLSRAVFLLLILLITFASLILSFRLHQTSDFGTGITAIQQANQRTDLLASINYHTRKLERLASYQLGVPSGLTYDQFQNNIKANLITLIDNLSTVQFDIMRATEVLNSKGASTVDSDSFIIESMISDTSVSTESRIYTDSVFQYITAASSIRNSTISLIIATNTTDSTPKNFFFVRRNGLGPLREGSEAEALNFYNFYLKTADDYNTKFKIIMIVAILVIALSDMILIPIVFSVHKTNDRVLAFFGYIPISEITELAAKCERYVQNYIEDHKQVRNYSFSDEEQEHLPHSQRTENAENSYLESQPNEEEVVEGDSINPDTSQLDVSEKIEASPVQNLRGSPPNKQATLNVPNNSKRVNTGGKTDRREMTSGEHTALKSKQDMMMLSSQDNSKVALKNQSGINRDDMKRTTMKDEDKKKEEAENEEAANDRSQKLLNSRNNRRTSVVIQFVVIAAIFGIFFLLDFVVIESNFLSNIRKTLAHLKLSAERMPNIRYLLAFTLEEIALGGAWNPLYNYADTQYDLRTYYENLITANEQTIQAASNLAFPSAFNNYLNIFQEYNDEDLCAAYYQPLGLYSTCQNVSSGTLTRGLTMAVTTLVLNTDDVLQTFSSAYNITGATAATQNASQIAAIQSAKFNNSDALVNKTMPAFQQLLDDYIVAYNDYLSQSNRTEGIKFAVFIIFCFLVFFALWQPYLKNLKDKIFRTKGMLNMIPMDIISKNENLRTQFLSGNILQAVK